MKKETKKKAAASAVAAVTAAGVLVGGAFADPDDILDDGANAVVQTLDMGSQTDDGSSGPDSGDEEDEGRRGIYASVRRIVRRVPQGVRAVLAVPLWVVGTVIIALVSSLWSAVLSPVASTVLGWLLIALLAAAVFAMAVKTVFPDMPLKKILNKRSLLTIVLSCLAFGTLDAVLPFFWENYESLSQLLKLLGSLICTGVPVLFFLRRHRRKKAAEPEVAKELTEEEKELATRDLIAELTDSVCMNYR